MDVSVHQGPVLTCTGGDQHCWIFVRDPIPRAFEKQNGISSVT